MLTSLSGGDKIMCQCIEKLLSVVLWAATGMKSEKNVRHDHWREKIPYLAAGTVFFVTSPNVCGWISSFWINLASVWHPFGKEPWTAQLLILWGFVVGFFFFFFSPGSPPTWPCPWTCREAPWCCFPAWWSRCAASQSRSWLARWCCPWWSEGLQHRVRRSGDERAPAHARQHTVCAHAAALTPEVKMAGLSLSNMLSSSSFVVFLPAESTPTDQSRSIAFVELLKKRARLVQWYSQFHSAVS